MPRVTLERVQNIWAKYESYAGVAHYEPNWDTLMSNIKDGLDLDVPFIQIKDGIAMVIGATADESCDLRYSEDECEQFLEEYEYQKDIRTGKLSREDALRCFIYMLAGEDF